MRFYCSDHHHRGFFEAASEREALAMAAGFANVMPPIHHGAETRCPLTGRPVPAKIYLCTPHPSLPGMLSAEPITAAARAQGSRTLPAPGGAA